MFQSPDLLAQRRLRNSQALRGAAEVQRVRHRQEIPEMTKLDLVTHPSII
jgi:hypothetical protein